MSGPWEDYAAPSPGPWQDFPATPAPAPSGPRAAGQGAADPRVRLVKYIGGHVVDATANAFGKLKADVKDDYDRTVAKVDPKGSGNAFSEDPLGLKSLGRTFRNLGDVVGVVTAPVAGAVDALVVDPAAKVFDQLPNPQVKTGGGFTADPRQWSATYSKPTFRPMTDDEEHQANRGMVGTALMAAGPEAAPAKVATAAKAPNAFAEHVAKFERSNVTPSLAAAGGRGASATANTVAENVIAGAPTRARLQRNVGEVQAQAGRLSDAYGANRGPQIAGEDVQAGVRRFARDNTMAPVDTTAPARATSFSAKAGVLYDEAFAPIEAAENRAVRGAHAAQSKVDDATGKAQIDADARAMQQAVLGLDKLPGGAKPVVRVQAGSVPSVPPVVSTTNTTGALQAIGGRVNAPELRGLITDPRIPSILDALQSDAGSVRFNDLRALRTWVRDAQTNQQLRQGISQAGLKQLEGALTQDIYANAQKLAGPEAVQRLKRADRFYAAGSGRIEKALQAFDDAASGESAYARIQQAAGSGSAADARKLLSLKRSLSPDEWGDVAATTIKQMGRPTKGAPGATGADGFSLSTFVSNYAGMSPRGREILFGSIGGGGKKASSLAAELDNLVSVAADLKGVERGANASKSFVNAQTASTIAGLAIPHTTVPTLGALGAMALTGEVMTNPLAVRWLANLGRAAKAGPAATSSAMGRLRAVARTNAALVPLLHAAEQALLPAPRQALAASAAADEEPQ